ncbi:hypothetical protein DV20_25515 [Amycolatopsis rifamycinica]|uniref:Uncharacterized protein n=1 Tax=Amycolatopsis rifamycinica TaxID=287986 RepID=A0A066U539_9PSEU|nr:hypothetical protein DV20_25515 [Amycolatopsis rifamycinica]
MSTASASATSPVPRASAVATASRSGPVDDVQDFAPHRKPAVLRVAKQFRKRLGGGRLPLARQRNEVVAQIHAAAPARAARGQVGEGHRPLRSAGFRVHRRSVAAFPPRPRLIRTG